MKEQNKKYLVFSRLNSLYALNLAQVAEVGDLRQISPIPFAPACYSGAINFHGDIVAVMDLSTFFGLSGFAKPGKIVVLHQDIASLAFIVDKIVRIVPEEEVTVGCQPESIFAAATLCFDGREAILINAGKLVSEAENCMKKNH